jgi:hypothetical protein
MRFWRVRAIQVKTAAAIGLAAVLGMASLAAASPGSPLPHEATVEPAPDHARVDLLPADPETDVTDGADTAQQSPADGEADDDADAADSEAPSAVIPGTCLTHGQRVSAIAQSTPPGPGHGSLVSAAAHDHTGECAHADDTENPADDTGDDVARSPAESPAPLSPAAPEDHGPPRHDSEGSPGPGNAHGYQKG